MSDYAKKAQWFVAEFGDAIVKRCGLPARFVTRQRMVYDDGDDSVRLVADLNLGLGRSRPVRVDDVEAFPMKDQRDLRDSLMRELGLARTTVERRMVKAGLWDVL